MGQDAAVFDRLFAARYPFEQGEPLLLLVIGVNADK